MDAETRAVMKGKKLASLRKLLEETGYVDSRVAEQNAVGFEMMALRPGQGSSGSMPSCRV